jgi:hypothetical protein
MPMDIWGAPYICSESSYPVPKGFDMSDWTPSVTQGNAGLSTERDRAAGPTWAAPTEIRRNSLDGDALAGMNVLLVDDDYRNLFAIKALLERTKAAVKIAARGPDAFYALQRTPNINIVLMDIMMPDMILPAQASWTRNPIGAALGQEDLRPPALAYCGPTTPPRRRKPRELVTPCGGRAMNPLMTSSPTLPAPAVSSDASLLAAARHDPDAFSFVLPN